MKKGAIWVLLASLVAVVVALWPRDYYFAPCIQWKGVVPNGLPCDSFWVTWWTELGWPKKWFLLVGGGKYGGDLQIDTKILGQNLAINFGLAIIAFKIHRLLNKKWGAKKVVSGLVVIGIVSILVAVIKSDQLQLFLKPPFPLNEKGARYEIRWTDSGVYVFLGPPATESSSIYSLYYFPRDGGKSSKRVPIFKHPANIDELEINGQRRKHVKIWGRFRSEVGVVKCSEFPCQKFKVTGVDIDKVEIDKEKIDLPLVNPPFYP